MAKNPPPPPPEQSTPEYPAISGFIERASGEEVSGLYGDVKEALGSLKGPKAEHGKKAGKAVARTEELLQQLMQVREKLEKDTKGKGGGRR